MIIENVYQQEKGKVMKLLAKVSDKRRIRHIKGMCESITVNTFRVREILLFAIDPVNSAFRSSFETQIACLRIRFSYMNNHKVLLLVYLPTYKMTAITTC